MNHPENSQAWKARHGLYQGRRLRFLVGIELGHGLLRYLPPARVREATEMCRVTAMKRGSPPDSLYWFGYCLYREGRFEQAEAAAVAALHRCPGFADAWWLRGWACVQLNSVEEGMLHLRTAIGLKPRHAIAWAHLALALDRAGHRPAAVSALRRAVSLRPFDSSLRNCLTESCGSDCGP
jgi:tetratricopeptide (TPR) repeat protein